MSITIEQHVFELLPVGEYPAKIADIKLEDGQFGQQVKFTFEIPNGEEEPRTMWGWSSAKFTPASKLYAWTQAALGGGPIDRGYNFNSDDLIGKKVTLIVVVKEGDKGEFNRIDTIRPFRKPAPKPVVEAAADW